MRDDLHSIARHHVYRYLYCRYDEFFALSRRRFVPPNFAEMRHVLNIAQVSKICSCSMTSQACASEAIPLRTCSYSSVGPPVKGICRETGI